MVRVREHRRVNAVSILVNTNGEHQPGAFPAKRR